MSICKIFRFTEKVIFSVKRLSFLLLSISFLIASYSARGAVVYGVTVPDAAINSGAHALLRSNLLFKHQNDTAIPPMGVPRRQTNADFDFLVLVALLLFLGLIKQTQPNYLRDVFRAFGNATLSKRQLREQLQQNYLPGIMMDVLFCFSAAFFLLQVMKFFGIEYPLHRFPSVLLLVGLALCLAVIYFVKNLFLKIMGWAFQSREAMNTYSFNVTLFNRVLGVVLLPFIIILALGGGLLSQLCLIIALLIVLLLYIFRFVRSRQVFRYFLQLSKFHFILYLCTAEIIPFAVIVKLIGIWVATGVK